MRRQCSRTIASAREDQLSMTAKAVVDQGMLDFLTAQGVEVRVLDWQRPCRRREGQRGQASLFGKTLDRLLCWLPCKGNPSLPRPSRADEAGGRYHAVRGSDPCGWTNQRGLTPSAFPREIPPCHVRLAPTKQVDDIMPSEGPTRARWTNQRGLTPSAFPGFSTSGPLRPVLVPISPSIVPQFTAGEEQIERSPHHVGKHVPITVFVPLPGGIEDKSG